MFVWRSVFTIPVGLHSDGASPGQDRRAASTGLFYERTGCHRLTRKMNPIGFIDVPRFILSLCGYFARPVTPSDKLIFFRLSGRAG
jgi:hypothetical protein